MNGIQTILKVTWKIQKNKGKTLRYDGIAKLVTGYKPENMYFGSHLD